MNDDWAKSAIVAAAVMVVVDLIAILLYSTYEWVGAAGPITVSLAVWWFLTYCLTEADRPEKNAP
jgi:hypothetical protein